MRSHSDPPGGRRSAGATDDDSRGGWPSISPGGRRRPRSRPSRRRDPALFGARTSWKPHGTPCAVRRPDFDAELDPELFGEARGDESVRDRVAPVRGSAWRQAARGLVDTFRPCPLAARLWSPFATIALGADIDVPDALRVRWRGAYPGHDRSSCLSWLAGCRQGAHAIPHGVSGEEACWVGDAYRPIRRRGSRHGMEIAGGPTDRA